MSKVITHSLLLILTSTYLKLENITDYMINLERILELDGVKAFIFWVQLPSVSVVGDFNFWTQGEHLLQVRWDSSGIWEGFIPNVEKGVLINTRYNLITVE
jgi:1,4-alpha-glucan branching enzyme